ncbi:sperm surface protein Sp17-like isoform X2 [Pieris brassicae]|uniref:sperm surface protein Sp17-like isoform X2 n=1 Tax=Pieris brassicae TaxID=7116 RepID=UPI001E65ECAE|nr:sperm surface protein Sp17-like isoform X2 [Pieris brassicae]
MQNTLNENPGQISPPVGLQELMSDITREVLRAQPQNIYSFIANYLETLLEVRNNISIAADICNNLNESCYQTELIEELRNIGLIDEDVDKAADIIKDFLETDKVRETNLFLQILRKTSTQESQLAAIQNAVQKAFRKHRLNQSKINSCQKNAAW